MTNPWVHCPPAVADNTGNHRMKESVIVSFSSRATVAERVVRLGGRQTATEAAL